MEELTLSELLMQQYREIKEKFGGKDVICITEDERSHWLEMLNLLQEKKFIQDIEIDNGAIYRRMRKFEDFEKWYNAMEHEKAITGSVPKTSVSIETLVMNGSNMFFGDVINSPISINNSISNIERDISEKGGDDAEELKAILNEVKELIENIDDSRHIPKNKGLFQKITGHLDKHGWFYAEIVALLGTAAMNLLQG